ncbi:hypothetical protein I350_00292 [Cryptococcus amylolentus CBS 6273]|uniref:Uncharacterized protein n=1 Tax=Cryptococcus amylolentus CBS 6273 TaxID=1296118 RepID=A0A1E3KGR8_9TREE|nr:hypothetical protein I350_00292 [Cryptococcus amylolentus CBS 6273]
MPGLRRTHQPAQPTSPAPPVLYSSSYLATRMCFPHLDQLASQNKCAPPIPPPLISNPRLLRPLRPKRHGVQYAPRSLLSTYLRPKPSIYELCHCVMNNGGRYSKKSFVSRTKSYGPLNKPGHDLMLANGSAHKRVSLKSLSSNGHRDKQYSCLGRPITPADTWPVEELLCASLLASRATITPPLACPASTPPVIRERVFTPPPKIDLSSEEPLEREIFMQEIPGFATAQLEREIGLVAPDCASPHIVTDNEVLEVEVVTELSEGPETFDEEDVIALFESESCGSHDLERSGLKKSVTFNEETEVYWFEIRGGTSSEAHLDLSFGYKSDIEDNHTITQLLRKQYRIVPASPPPVEHRDFWNVVASLGISSPLQDLSDTGIQSPTHNSLASSLDAEQLSPHRQSLSRAEDASLDSVDEIVSRPEDQDIYLSSDTTPIPTQHISLHASSIHLSESFDDTPTKMVTAPRILSHTVRPPIMSPCPTHLQGKKNSRHPRRDRKPTLTPVLYAKSTRRS